MWSAHSADFGQTWQQEGDLPSLFVASDELLCTRGTCLVPGLRAHRKRPGRRRRRAERRRWADLGVGLGARGNRRPAERRLPHAADCLAAGTTATTVSDVVPAKGELLDSIDGGHTWAPAQDRAPVDDVYGLACPSAAQCAMVGTKWFGFPAIALGAVAQSVDGGDDLQGLAGGLRAHHPDGGLVSVRHRPASPSAGTPWLASPSCTRRAPPTPPPQRYRAGSDRAPQGPRSFGCDRRRQADAHSVGNWGCPCTKSGSAALKIPSQRLQTPVDLPVRTAVVMRAGGARVPRRLNDGGRHAPDLPSVSDAKPLTTPTIAPTAGLRSGPARRPPRLRPRWVAEGLRLPRLRPQSRDRRCLPTSSTRRAGRWPTGSPAWPPSCSSSACSSPGSRSPSGSRATPSADRVNGLWHGWMYLTLIISILIVAYLVLRAGWDRLPISQDVPHLTVMLVGDHRGCRLDVDRVHRQAGWQCHRLGLRRRRRSHCRDRCCRALRGSQLRAKTM